MRNITIAIAVVLIFTTTGFAQDSMASNIYINLGAVEVVTLPQVAHVGLYLYAGLSRPVELSSGSLVIPSLSIEWSPELARWGFVVACALDIPISETIGIDIQGTLLHDQESWRFSKAVYYVGPGAGVSFYIGSVTLSPSVNAFYGLNDDSWSLAPAINISW